MCANVHKPQEHSLILLKDFFNRSQANISISRRPNVFLPDEWTQAFAAGLEKLPSLQAVNRSVLEVGVGTGVVMAGLLTQPQTPLEYIGVDICGDAIQSAQALADKHEWRVKLKASDLLTNMTDAELHYVTHIVACIPQVPAKVDLSEADNSAHYYLPQGSTWDSFGLGLNAALLDQARNRAPQASVTLNLSGRPGLERLNELFREYGYNAEVVHETMVSQHGDTSLRSLADLECDGCAPFEFYADEAGQQRISAVQAEARRLNQAPVFHKIYVLSAPAFK